MTKEVVMSKPAPRSRSDRPRRATPYSTFAPGPSRVLPERASLDQLRKQAKDLLAGYRAGQAEAVADVERYERSTEERRFVLTDAQRVLARAYGFASWPRLVAHVGRPGVRMLRPHDIRPEVWDTLTAAATGDVRALRSLLARDAGLADEAYWYTPPLHLAVREGRLEAVRLLLDAGADPGGVGLSGEDLVTTARDRGHEEIARLLEAAAERRRRTAPDGLAASDHAIHAAAAADDVEAVRGLLDAEPDLVHRGDRKGGTPLHRAVDARARRTIELLLDRGADVHALHGRGPGDGAGYAPADFQPIDVALWRRADVQTARYLVARGAAFDLAVAAALGDAARVEAFLDEDPDRIRESRPCGVRALSAAARFGHEEIVRLLLERGADPTWPEADAPRGAALYFAARGGSRSMVERLLDHGADPSAPLESSGNATYAARTPELRSLLLARGGTLDPYDLVFLDEDEEVMRRVRADPASADRGCGGVLAAACTQGKRELLVRLLEAGVRVPPVLTACRGYLLADPDMLRLLLGSGMDPDLPNWQHATPLHDLCSRDGRGRAAPHRLACAEVLLDAGANVSARDDEYRSTPLAWAARSNLPDMVELLLARGAPVSLPDDEPWATPLAWATRRGHREVEELLRRATGPSAPASRARTRSRA
jgi:ankyrin repeat protein